MDADTMTSGGEEERTRRLLARLSEDLLKLRIEAESDAEMHERFALEPAAPDRSRELPPIAASVPPSPPTFSQPLPSPPPVSAGLPAPPQFGELQAEQQQQHHQQRQFYPLLQRHVEVTNAAVCPVWAGTSASASDGLTATTRGTSPGPAATPISDEFSGPRQPVLVYMQPSGGVADQQWQLQRPGHPAAVATVPVIPAPPLPHQLPKVPHESPLARHDLLSSPFAVPPPPPPPQYMFQKHQQQEQQLLVPLVANATSHHCLPSTTTTTTDATTSVSYSSGSSTQHVGGGVRQFSHHELLHFAALQQQYALLTGQR